MTNKVSDRMISKENLENGYSEDALKAARFAFDMSMTATLFHRNPAYIAECKSAARIAALKHTVKQLTYLITSDLNGRLITQDQTNALAQNIFELASDAVSQVCPIEETL